MKGLRLMTVVFVLMTVASSVVVAQYRVTTINLGFRPGYLLHNPTTENTYVGADVDPLAAVLKGDTIRATIELPKDISQLYTVDSMTWVSTYRGTSSRICKIDPFGDSLLAKVRVGEGALKVVKAGHKMYVACWDECEVWVIDLNGDTVVAVIEMDGYPLALCYLPEVNRVSVGVTGYPADRVEMIDIEKDSVVAVSQGLDGTASQILWNGSRLYVAGYENIFVFDANGQTMAVINLINSSPNQMEFLESRNELIIPSGEIIDCQTNARCGFLPRQGIDLAIDQLRNVIYLLRQGHNDINGWVYVIDGQSRDLLDSIEVGHSAQRIAINGRGKIWVINWYDETVSCITDTGSAIAEHLEPDLEQPFRLTIIRRIGSSLVCNKSSRLIDISGRTVQNLVSGANVLAVKPGIYFLDNGQRVLVLR